MVLSLEASTELLFPQLGLWIWDSFLAMGWGRLTMWPWEILFYVCFLSFQVYFHSALYPEKLIPAHSISWASLSAGFLLGSASGSPFPAWSVALGLRMASTLRDQMSPCTVAHPGLSSHWAPLASPSRLQMVMAPSWLSLDTLPTLGVPLTSVNNPFKKVSSVIHYERISIFIQVPSW